MRVMIFYVRFPVTIFDVHLLEDPNGRLNEPFYRPMEHPYQRRDSAISHHTGDGDDDEDLLNDDDDDIVTGARVELHGLTGTPALNGRRGLAVEWISRQERWAVVLDGEDAGAAAGAAAAAPRALRTANLKVISLPAAAADEDPAAAAGGGRFVLAPTPKAPPASSPGIGGGGGLDDDEVPYRRARYGLATLFKFEMNHDASHLPGPLR